MKFPSGKLLLKVEQLDRQLHALPELPESEREVEQLMSYTKQQALDVVLALSAWIVEDDDLHGQREERAKKRESTYVSR